MKTAYIVSRICIFLLVIAFVTSCKGQTHSNPETHTATRELSILVDAQIGDYITEIFEDSKGQLWFGTLEKGAARYDGRTFRYFTTTDGLPSNRIVSIVEDLKGDLWFGTGSGLSQYDGKTFTNFTTENGICNNMISSVLLDSNGVFWIGTWNGVCKFSDGKFTSVTIPRPPINTPINEDTKNWVTVITKDSKGNLWFALDGSGASKYDGKTFTHYTKMDGLASNHVQEIQEDAQGTFWFGTRVGEKDLPNPDKRFGPGGLNTYDGENFMSFPDLKGLNRSDVYEIYRDSKDNIWIGTIDQGVYKYDGTQFTNYSGNTTDNGFPKAVMTIFEDRKGTMWIGCAGGLFRLDSEGIVNITTHGPWD